MKLGQGRGLAQPLLLTGAAVLAVWGIVQSMRNGNGGNGGSGSFLLNPAAVAQAGNGASANIRVHNPGSQVLDYALVTEFRNSAGQVLSVAPGNFGALDPGESVTETATFTFGLPSPIFPNRNYTVRWQLFVQNTANLLDSRSLTVTSTTLAAQQVHPHYHGRH